MRHGPDDSSETVESGCLAQSPTTGEAGDPTVEPEPEADSLIHHHSLHHHQALHQHSTSRGRHHRQHAAHHPESNQVKSNRAGSTEVTTRPKTTHESSLAT